jgi:MarR family 2-MHQ and catechol resistance regulon transcriptional repressor
MGTHYKGKDKELLALNTWIKLARASDTVFKSIKPSMVTSGLTHTQFAVLESLWHLGSMSQTKLGVKLLRTSGNIVKVIDNLERVQLVKRDLDKQDRRAHKIRLTQKGIDIIKSIFSNHVKVIVETFSILNNSEQTELSRICKKLGRVKK